MKFVYATLIALGVYYYTTYSETISTSEYIIVAAIVGWMLKEYERMSKTINDLKRYKSIDDVLKKYGVPDNIQEFDEYKKYTFKKSTNGWGHNKYKVDIFTLKDNQLVKHENFYE